MPTAAKSKPGADARTRSRVNVRRALQKDTSRTSQTSKGSRASRASQSSRASQKSRKKPADPVSPKQSTLDLSFAETLRAEKPVQTSEDVQEMPPQDDERVCDHQMPSQPAEEAATKTKEEMNLDESKDVQVPSFAETLRALRAEKPGQTSEDVQKMPPQDDERACDQQMPSQPAEEAATKTKEEMNLDESKDVQVPEQLQPTETTEEVQVQDASKDMPVPVTTQAELQTDPAAAPPQSAEVTEVTCLRPPTVDAPAERSPVQNLAMRLFWSNSHDLVCFPG